MPFLNFSILGRVIRVTDEVIEYRKWIRDHFPLSNSQNLPRIVPIFSRPVLTGATSQSPYITGSQPRFYTFEPYPSFPVENTGTSTGNNSSNQSSRSSSSSAPESFGDTLDAGSRSGQISPVDTLCSKPYDKPTLVSSNGSAFTTRDETMNDVGGTKDQPNYKQDSAYVSISI